MMLKKLRVRRAIKRWLGGAYDVRLGDSSNPDYYGPKQVEELVDAIMVIFKERKSG